MKSTIKIVATALATAIFASAISVSAFAHDSKNYKGPGVLPFLAGPVAAAAIAGPVTSTWFTTNTLYFKFNWWTWKWQPVSYCHGHGCYAKEVKVKHSSKSINGKAVVGCIFGSALGAITASVRKATALGNPPRWRSQAEHEKIVASGYEKQFELTNDEAQTAIAACGLGSFALHWEKSAPVVKAKY